MKNKKGFTLIELLSVILLVAVVASISVYTIFSVIENARKKTYQVTIKNIEGNAESYIGENDDKDFIDIGGGKESQCVTVKDLVDYGYLDNKVIKAKVDKDTTVSLSDKVYIEREASTKTVTKSVYVGKTDKNNICPLGSAYIIITPTKEELKPTHEQKVKIAYYIDNRLVNDFDKYKCTYEYVPKDSTNATLKGESEAIQELTLTYNGDLYANIYLRGKEATEDEAGTEDEHIIDAHLEVTNIDNEAPAIMIDAKTKLRSTTQEVDLVCEDDVTKVVGYYYGLTEPTSETKYKSVAKQQSVKIKQIIDYQHPGTYYFSCEDEAGNRTEPQAITFYNYIVENRMETASGKQGTYDSTNYELISKATYIAKEGTVLTLNGTYTRPDYASGETFNGMSVGSASGNVETLTKESPTLTENNKTYTMWFDRNSVNITYVIVDPYNASTNKNGENLAATTTEGKSPNITTYNWTTNSNKQIMRQIDGGTSTVLKTRFKYRASEISLYNIGGTNGSPKITKSGKKFGAYLCDNGCSDMSLSIGTKITKAADIAKKQQALCSDDILKVRNCDVTLKIRWDNPIEVDLSCPSWPFGCGGGGGGCGESSTGAGLTIVWCNDQAEDKILVFDDGVVGGLL